MTAADEFTGSTSSRRLALGAGVGGLVTVSAACGSGDDAAPTTSGSGAASGARVSAADVPVGGGVILTTEKIVVTQPSAGEYKAFSAICTHQQCLVDKVEATIDCSCHGSQFSIADGSVVQEPATAPLTARTATLEGDEIVVT